MKLIDKINHSIAEMDNDIMRRCCAILAFICVGLFVTVAAFVELIFRIIVAVGRETVQYFNEIKDQLLHFVQEYIELW